VKFFLRLLTTVLVTWCIQASAQTYSADWHKVAGGGGVSTGGVYSVNGTAGQHDASGPMTGGPYSVTGGYWALSAVQTPGAPFLKILLSNTNTAIVSWTAPSVGWILQQNTNLALPAGWSNATNAVTQAGGQNEIIVARPTGNRFYRLFHP
jgi:hypothetical protein